MLKLFGKITTQSFWNIFYLQMVFKLKIQIRKRQKSDFIKKGGYRTMLFMSHFILRYLCETQNSVNKIIIFG